MNVSLRGRRGAVRPRSSERRTQWMRWFSLGRTLFWLALTAPAFALGLLSSVTFVSLLSIWALVETAFAAWRSDENPESKRIREMDAKLDDLLARLDAERRKDAA
jgi:hypothetical protein